MYSTDDDDDNGPDNFKIDARILFFEAEAGSTYSSANSTSSRVKLPVGTLVPKPPAGGCFAANLPEMIFCFACMIFWRNVGSIGEGCATLGWAAGRAPGWAAGRDPGWAGRAPGWAAGWTGGKGANGIPPFYKYKMFNFNKGIKTIFNSKTSMNSILTAKFRKMTMINSQRKRKHNENWKWYICLYVKRPKVHCWTQSHTKENLLRKRVWFIL